MTPTATTTVPATGSDSLVEGHMNLARGLARRFVGRGEPYDDLCSVAYGALVAAAHRYDPDRGAAFATYATASILGELKRHFRDRVWWVRAPRRLHDLFLQVSEAREHLLQQLGRTPTIADIAQHLDRREHDILEALEAADGYRRTSLEAPTGTGEPLVDTLGHTDPNVEGSPDRVQLTQELAGLTDQERALLTRYYVDGLTQADIAQELSCSQVQVSRLLIHLHSRLKRRLAVSTGAAP